MLLLGTYLKKSKSGDLRETPEFVNTSQGEEKEESPYPWLVKDLSYLAQNTGRKILFIATELAVLTFNQALGPFALTGEAAK
ncbi:hypothetical protein STEG23_028479 [Scotinomys teguina]